MTVLITLCIASRSNGQNAGGDAILGIWKAQEKTLTIEIYKQGQEYRARLMSFTDHHNSIAAADRTDEHNADASKRSRKLIGIDVLTGLHYSAANDEWSDGKIYDVSSGGSYSASASLDEEILTVRAYKGISMFGKTLHFQR